MTDEVEKPVTILCTLDPSDSGPRCLACGWAAGPGHGKRVEPKR
mgnify:CR=1 FL=1